MTDLTDKQLADKLRYIAQVQRNRFGRNADTDTMLQSANRIAELEAELAEAQKPKTAAKKTPAKKADT